jgi:hypothetical protein
MGWPDHVATRDYPELAGKMHYFLFVDSARDILQEATKLETAVIDKVAEACFASQCRGGVLQDSPASND